MAAKKLPAVAIITLCCILVCVILIFWRDYFNVAEPGRAGSCAVHDDGSLNIFDFNHFFEGVRIAENEPINTSRNFRGGIVPHHLLPNYILSDFFRQLSAAHPVTVILISPNHENTGGKILTSDSDWQTVFGCLPAGKAAINRLIASGQAVADDTAVKAEASVRGLMPYIKYYLPDSAVVPIIVRRDVTAKESRTLALSLAEITGKRNVIIASADFSHYLDSSQAQKNDLVTVDIIKRLDYGGLYSLNDDYVDSPPVLGIFLMSMQKGGHLANEIRYDTNSGIILGEKYRPTTSYISMLYW